jgi:hypothetical protein
MLPGGVLLPGVVKAAGLSQADVAEGGRLVDGKAHRTGGVGVAEVAVAVDTSGLKFAHFVSPLFCSCFDLAGLHRRGEIHSHRMFCFHTLSSDFQQHKTPAFYVKKCSAQCQEIKK